MVANFSKITCCAAACLCYISRSVDPDRVADSITTEPITDFHPEAGLIEGADGLLYGTVAIGTYANNATCAVSATGDGEYFIRAVVGHEVSALIEYRGMSVQDAADATIKKVGELGGTGGLIALDRNGNVAMPFNTSGMYRGRVDPTGKFIIDIYK